MRLLSRLNVSLRVLDFTYKFFSVRIFQMVKQFKLAFQSINNYLSLVYHRKLHLSRKRLWALFEVDHGGRYAIFRESYVDAKVMEPTVMVFGFRLFIIGSNPFMHWLFQRVCILTTPIWSGFPGFNIKLWMVDPETKDYIGIYQWDSKKKLRVYADYLEKILLRLSTKGSVWYEIIENQELEPYLAKRAVIDVKLATSEETE